MATGSRRPGPRYPPRSAPRVRGADPHDGDHLAASEAHSQDVGVLGTDGDDEGKAAQEASDEGATSRVSHGALGAGPEKSRGSPPSPVTQRGRGRGRDKTTPQRGAPAILANTKRRCDAVGRSGTRRYRTKLHHFGLGRAHGGQRVLILTSRPDWDVRVIDEGGTMIRHLTIEPSINDQRQGQKVVWGFSRPRESVTSQWCGRRDSNPHSEELVPKTSASANSATPADSTSLDTPSAYLVKRRDRFGASKPSFRRS